MEQHKTARWITIVAVVTLLAVFSWRLLVIALVAVACIAAFQGGGLRLFRPGAPRCLKCGEPMKSSERWCRECGSASWTRN